MASWYRKRGKDVYVLVHKNGKTKALPRAETKHLDSEPDHNVDFWVRQWELKDNPDLKVTSDASLTKLVHEYTAYLRSIGRTPGTIDEHNRHLLNNVIPFFLEREPRLVEPNLWPSVSIKMLTALMDKGLTSSQINRCNISLRCFFKWLAEENVVMGDGRINLRNPPQNRQQKKTPLKVFLAPDQVLEMMRNERSVDMKRMLVLGYFFSLRPQEAFGMMVGELRLGGSVKTLEASKAMKSIDLYDGLVANVQRQKSKQNKLTDPKWGSKGWVACFNKEAAKLLIQTLKDKGPADFIVDSAPNKIYKDWPYDFDIKDLRRASLYWLGHNTDIGQNKLMKHARHHSYETTLLYLRRPDEDLDEWSGLDVADL